MITSDSIFIVGAGREFWCAPGWTRVYIHAHQYRTIADAKRAFARQDAKPDNEFRRRGAQIMTWGEFKKVRPRWGDNN